MKKTNGVVVAQNITDFLKAYPAKSRLFSEMIRTQTQGEKLIIFDTEGEEYKGLCDYLGIRIIGPAEQLQKEIAELQESGVEIPVLDIDPETELIKKEDKSCTDTD